MPSTVILNASSGTLNGDASASGNNIDLLDGSVPETGSPSTGSAYFDQQITLNQDFNFTFSATLSGADGFAVVLHNDPDGVNAIGDVGRQIGTGGIQDGVGIEFDTYQNSPSTGGDETSDNHSNMVDTDGNIYHSSADISAANNTLPVDLNDEAPHDFVISWDASQNTMTWSIDGTQVGARTFTDAELDTYLTSDRSVFIGVASGNYLQGDTQLANASLTANFVCIEGSALVTVRSGDIPLEQLEVGDHILTDRGEFVPVRWIGSRTLNAQELRANPQLYPIRITSGALGNGLPKRDLLVSRQHRMKVSSKISARVTDRAEVLIPAFRLTRLSGIDVATDVESVVYFHVLCDQHEVIFAEGAPTETLLPREQALELMDAEQREEIYAILPELKIDPELLSAAMYIPSADQQREIVERHDKNKRDLLKPS